MINQGMDINSVPSNGAINLVGLAIYFKKINILKELLGAGAKTTGIEARNNFVIACASNIRDTSIINLLLEHGFDINSLNDKNQNCLNKAVETSDVEFFSYLISKGADPDIKITPGKALGIERNISNRELIDLLLNNNTNMKKRITKHSS